MLELVPSAGPGPRQGRTGVDRGRHRAGRRRLSRRSGARLCRRSVRRRGDGGGARQDLPGGIRRGGRALGPAVPRRARRGLGLRGDEGRRRAGSGCRNPRAGADDCFPRRSRSHGLPCQRQCGHRATGRRRCRRAGAILGRCRHRQRRPPLHPHPLRRPGRPAGGRGLARARRRPCLDGRQRQRQLHRSAGPRRLRRDAALLPAARELATLYARHAPQSSMPSITVAKRGGGHALFVAAITACTCSTSFGSRRAMSMSLYHPCSSSRTRRPTLSGRTCIT